MKHKTNKIILFVNGELPAPRRFVSQLTSEDVLVAVDGGLAHMIRLGLTPNLIIGDLDSANHNAVQQFQSQGIEVRKYPEDKDETDLELALDAALAMNPVNTWK